VSFPSVLHAEVRRQIESMKTIWRFDDMDNPGGVSLPFAYGKKSSKSHREFAWYFLFCSECLSRDQFGALRRHHMDGSNVNRNIREAARRAGLTKRITSHTLRHSYATHCNEMGMDIRTLQVLLGHTSLETTMAYVHANKDKATASRSPLEALSEPQRVATETQRLKLFGS